MQYNVMKEVENILKSGLSLKEEMGVNNWAFHKTEALNVLNELLKLQVPILGGDVCEKIDDVIQYNYDNWHCDRVKNESENDYIERSIRHTQKYIENYPKKDSENIFFAFVVEIYFSDEI